MFVTEATFALPVFRHEKAHHEVEKLLASMAAEPDRTHLIGAYGLGKCQRMIRVIRDAGYDKPIYLHGAVMALTELYQKLGIDLGDVRPVAGTDPKSMRGGIVMCPPSALGDRWSRRFGDPVNAFASGWMRVRGRARQRGIELPLVVSDHVDWPELIQTIAETGAEEIWVTHGREDALVHYLATLGRKARALALVGRDEEARIAMRAFARLLDCLVYTQSRNRKVALLGRYFRTTPDPDRGWALAALTDGVPVRLPLRRMLTDLVSRFIDPVLYRLSRDYVGDTAETVALLWPDRVERASPRHARRGAIATSVRRVNPKLLMHAWTLRRSLPSRRVANERWGRLRRADRALARPGHRSECRTARRLSARSARAAFSISSMPPAVGRF